jgi:ankyrin repeat protein
VQDGDVGNQQLRNSFGISHGGNDRVVLSARTLAAKARLYQRIAHAISVLKGDAEFESQLVGRVLQPHEIFLATITAEASANAYASASSDANPSSAASASPLHSTPTLLSSPRGPDMLLSVNPKLMKRLLNRNALTTGVSQQQRSRSRRELNAGEPDYKGFCVSVLEGDLEAVSACLESFPEFVSVSDAKGATAAHLASRSGDMGMIHLLKSAKASLVLQNQSGETPLHLLLGSHAPSSQVVQLLQGALRTHEITLEQVNNAGDTLLHYACWSLGDEAAHFLIDSGADVNAANNAGVTPLLIAVVCYKVSLVESLLERGANVWAQTIDRENPLLFAMQSDSSNLSSCVGCCCCCCCCEWVCGVALLSV